MNGDDLEVFRAVAEELSFTKAAKRLHVTVSSVSQRVRRLERQFGTVLLARNTRNVALTREGRILLDGARQRAALDQRIVSSITGGSASPAAPAAQTLGIVRVDVSGLLGYLEDGGAPTSHTPWEIISLADAPAGLAAVVKDEVACLLWSDWDDLGLARTPSDIIARITSEVIFDEPSWLYVAADHPLAARREVELADLSGETWIASGDEIARQVLLRAARSIGGFEPHIAYFTDDPRLSADLVRTGRAVDLGPPAAEPIPGVVMVPLVAGPMTRIRISVPDHRPPSDVHDLARTIRRWYLDSARDDNPAYWARLHADRGTTEARGTGGAEPEPAA